MNSLRMTVKFVSLTVTALCFCIASGADEMAKEAGAQNACAAKINNANAKLADLTVTITGLRSTKGHILASVYSEVCGGFPDQDKLAFFNTQIASTDGVNFVVEVPPGKYAIAILHDANDNKKMDTFAGVPKEGFGFSNNAMKPFGPPSFDQATVVVPAHGASASITMKYML